MMTPFNFKRQSFGVVLMLPQEEIYIIGGNNG